MVHPAALAISFGVVLGGAIFALIFMSNNRNEERQHRYQQSPRPRPRPDPLELIQEQLES